MDQLDESTTLKLLRQHPPTANRVAPTTTDSHICLQMSKILYSKRNISLPQGNICYELLHHVLMWFLCNCFLLFCSSMESLPSSCVSYLAFFDPDKCTNQQHFSKYSPLTILCQAGIIHRCHCWLIHFFWNFLFLSVYCRLLLLKTGRWSADIKFKVIKPIVLWCMKYTPAPTPA